MLILFVAIVLVIFFLEKLKHARFVLVIDYGSDCRVIVGVFGFAYIFKGKDAFIVFLKYLLEFHLEHGRYLFFLIIKLKLFFTTIIIIILNRQIIFI